MMKEEFEKVKAAVQRALCIGAEHESQLTLRNLGPDDMGPSEYLAQEAIKNDDTHLGLCDSLMIDACLAHAGLSAPEEEPPRDRLYTAAEVREIAERAALLASASAGVVAVNARRFDVSEISAAEVVVEDDMESIRPATKDRIIVARAVALAMPEAKEGK